MRTGVAYKIEERREQQMWKNRNKCKKEAYKEQKENRGKEKREKKKRNTAQEVSLILTKKKYRVIGKEKRKDNMIWKENNEGDKKIKWIYRGRKQNREYKKEEQKRMGLKT